MDFAPSAATEMPALDSLASVGGAFNDCKPRGSQFHLTITVDPQAKDMSCKVSSTGNDFDVRVPLGTSWSQGKLRAIVKG